MTSMSKKLGTLALIGLVPTVGLACGDVLSLDVVAPGRITEDALNTAQAIPGLVAGMSYDLSQSIDGALQDINVADGDTGHGGSYDLGTYPRGILFETPEDWDGEFGSFQQARWVAEDGLRRIATILEPADFAKNFFVARAYVLAGFANLRLGEVQCTSTIDGGPEVSNTEHFNRADSLFARAAAVAAAAGNDDLLQAAHGGRASVRAWLEDWPGAVTEAQAVDVGLTYDAIFSEAVGAIDNDFVFETHNRKEYSMFGSIWEFVPDDPRVPWQILLDNAGEVEKGQDGETPFYRQELFTSEGDDMPLIRGTEMLTLRAEAALRSGDLAGMTALLNEARDFVGMDPLAVPASVADAWPIMRFERSATVWLMGKRIYDLRRWKDEGGVVADPFAADRDTCWDISDEERRSNPNL